MKRKPRRSRNQRIKANAEILLQHASADMNFDGDFVELARRIGWTTGVFWSANPAIGIARKRWETTARRSA